MKRFAVIAALLMIVAAPGLASPVVAARFETTPGPEVLGGTVSITLVNEGTVPVTMGETWDLEYLDGDGSAFYQWPEEERTLEPGDSRTWMWDQRINRCYGECVNVREGDPAPVGSYRVTTTAGGIEEMLVFNLGQFFTIGFRFHPEAEFKVFVATAPEVDQMTTEAAKPHDEKTLITSGFVRKGRPRFNPDWNFSMGARSVGLGEYFIEVCDASPYYIQENRDHWLGDRWCPWSSYVKRVGL